LGEFLVWVITVYSKGNITMFELDTEEEAREAFKNIQGCKILSEIVYFNDPCFALDAV
jgi:ArsR family metal-binding transcriptional regulator